MKFVQFMSHIYTPYTDHNLIAKIQNPKKQTEKFKKASLQNIQNIMCAITQGLLVVCIEDTQFPHGPPGLHLATLLQKGINY